MTFTNIAKIVQWNDEKGFGFAEANGIKYFVHISAFGPIARRPRIGDTITVEKFGKGEKGPRIEKGILDGITTAPRHIYAYPRKTGNSLRYKLRDVMIVVCIIAAVISGINSWLGNRPGNLKIPHSETSKVLVQGIDQNGAYTKKMDVAKYICQYGQLPHNYVDKYTGKRMYEEKTGKYFSKWNFNPLTTLGVMIGGDSFSNHEGLLPNGYWKEADVDYYASNRGTNRLVYSSGCNIYYTGDHYKSFSKIEF